MSKILGVAGGVLMVLLGIFCVMTPIETYGMVSWLIAFAMVADGISKIALFLEYQRAGEHDVWALVGGILSIVFGIVLAGSLAMRVAVDVFVAYVASFWVLFAGCVRIVRSFRMRNVQRTLDARLGSNWELALVVGILMVMLGLFCVANPTIVMVALGWQVGFAVIACGIGLISATV